MYSIVSMIVTRDIEVRSIPAKATLTGLMEELWLKFEGKERWIKSLQMGNNLLEKYFYWHGLEWQLGTFFVFGRSSNTVRLINWQTRKFGTEAQTFYAFVKKGGLFKLDLFNRRPKGLALKKKEKIMCFLHVMCDFPRAVIWRAKRKIVPSKINKT